ncbi:hypothetical protein UAW_02549 [Enterococcus haemoperoxidus ATCC BAA-382]|uniref:Uncharacterized protein n=1 Tax=Enterococcus haemoperoxidus ATCC BAA-382 TaxID=1158608 RepID=R2SKB8_9ENTE|nr:hypothetical protein [Enterococcus haemoperoxidus]EOH93301.1 hypothetical protein UAW_02549 [Enterococcus haemoperoxidus ATCC BAA-382]EOT61256.1 hypothetical protein I583_00234 [Enterococcus haemoperoxidus ATCC BAA-382]OJG54436.1 hypothetical protein RV06_GL002779 [Enterococcus haemoperoxidus]
MKIEQYFSYGYLFETKLLNKHGESITKQFVSMEPNEEIAMEKIISHISLLQDFKLHQIKLVDEVWMVTE